MTPSTARTRSRGSGITCALCHSTVDDSFAPGIGKRLDGWPNRDLDVGAIVALSPALERPTKAVFNAWGQRQVRPALQPGRHERPAGHPARVRPRRASRITATGDGDDIAYWNRYVARDPDGRARHLLRAADRRPVTNGTDDLVSGKLPGLQAYQLSLAAPAAARRQLRPRGRRAGQAGLRGRGQVLHLPQRRRVHRREHAPPPGRRRDGRAGASRRSELRVAQRDQAVPDRAAEGVWQHPPYFHNGSAATLEDVVRTYNERRSLGLTPSSAPTRSVLKSL